MKITAYIIIMDTFPASVGGYKKCIESINKHNCDIEAIRFRASTPETLDADVAQAFNNKHWKEIWNYPMVRGESRHVPEGNINIHPYLSPIPERRVGCSVSHYRLWQTIAASDNPALILEHDVLFTRKFSYSDVEPSFTGLAACINDPRRATRRSPQFDQGVKEFYKKAGSGTQCVDAPYVDKPTVPQGLAGNSAYLLKPQGAKVLLDLVDKHGLWPNDALMCKQLMPDQLQCVYPYYTTIQGLKSTTEARDVR
jgi:GR25 family glycosyltransferase involved in LPS biosynthesis